MDIVSIAALWKDFDAVMMPLNVAFVNERESGCARIRSFYFSGIRAADGVARVYAEFACPKDKGKYPVIVAYGDADEMPDAHCVDSFVKSGFAVLSVDYCGRSDKRARHTLYPASLAYAEYRNAKDTVYSTSGDLQKNCWVAWAGNAMRAVSVLSEIEEADTSQIVVMGKGLGSDMVWKAAAVDKRIRAAVVVLPRNYGGRRSPYLDAASGEKDAAMDTTGWTAVISPQSYAQHIKCPLYAAVASNEPSGGFDSVSQCFSRLTNPMQHLSVSERASDALTSEQTDSMILFINTALRGEKLPERPVFNCINSGGKLQFSCKTDAAVKAERVDIFYCSGGREPAGRNWHSLKVNFNEESGEYLSDYEAGFTDKNFFAFASVKFESGFHTSGKLIARTPKSLGIEKSNLRASKLVYDDTMGTDCFFCSGSYCFGGNVRAEYAVGPLDIGGVSAPANEKLATYKLGDAFFAPDKESVLVINLFAEYAGEVRITIVKTEGSRQEYTAKRQLAGAAEWQKLTFERKDFRSKDNVYPPEWQEISLLVADGTSKIIVSTVLWA